MKDKAEGGLWRVQAVFDLPTERFSAFDLTDETVGEQFDRATVVPGEIRIGDRYYLQPDRIANVLAAKGDIIVRARHAEGMPLAWGTRCTGSMHQAKKPT